LRSKIRFIAALFGSAIAMLIIARVWPLPDGFFAPGSTVVEFRDGSPAHVFLSPDEKWRIGVPVQEIDAAYLRALIRLEDKRFGWHLGFDPLAMVRALFLNLTRGRVVSGGSTITMQLVRVREPRPRTVASKLIELFRALQIEVRFSKKEILAAYLQYVPYGRNVEGLEAASLAYFGHRATALSSAEIATLLAVPQNPTHRFPTPANRDRLVAARDEIARRLALNSVSGPAPTELRAFPRFAPHAAIWLRDHAGGRLRIKTTLDRGAQILAEKTLDGQKDELRLKGIHNGSVVIVDHKSDELRALVGNLDFFDERHGGQIIGFDNPRSPGSALKPFLYAMGIDRGLVLPDFLVLDTPKVYGSYSPKNYDGRFAGLVRMEDALSRSLNVPFVNLLRKIGVERFIGTLRAMGAESLDDQLGFYGLSAAIGGVEITPLEMAALYATLAENGRYRKLRWIADEEREDQDGFAAFSSGAAYLTRRSLSLKDRPDFPQRRRMNGTPPHIHWKTGTSFGHRDAWSAGSGPRYTAVVWLGNFDNTPAVSLVGAEAAGPILFDILEGLTTKGAEMIGDYAPKDLVSVEVCAYSGRLPGPACEHKKRVLALEKNVPTEKCGYHVALDIDDETGLALSPACRADRRYRTETFVVWPSSLRRWLDDEHRRLPEPPSYAPGCESASAHARPSIISPPPNHTALLIPGLARDKQEIPFAADTAGASAKLSWFVDGAYLGTLRSEERLWWTPIPGAHEIVVTDEAGRSSKRHFEVKSSL
jgi:penicillin-binding protein 1C